MEALWVINFKLQAFLRAQLVEAEIDRFGELGAKLGTDERLRAMLCYLSQQLDYHVCQLHLALGAP